jgi:hypothetical protein
MSDTNEPVSLHDVIETDAPAFKEMVAQHPELFGDGRPLKLIYGVPFRNVVAEQQPFPRQLTDDDVGSVHGKHRAPALRMSEQDIDKLLRTRTRIQHDGKMVDAQFIGHKTINGDTFAVAVILQDTDERRKVADKIGPDRELKALSAGAKWPVNFSTKQVLNEVELDHVAFTDDPYDPTYIYMASSKEAVQLESDFSCIGMFKRNGA